MPQTIRQKQILYLLKKNGYATVKELMNVLHYSSATINRDLNAMQAAGLVKRSYGGVEAVDRIGLPPLPQRQSFMKKTKRKIACEAAAVIEDGDFVFLDGSTTVQHMVPFLLEKKDLKVVTNSLRVALELGEHHIDVFCLGGFICEYPHVLGGDVTVENSLQFHTDKMFFSTNMITETGHVFNGNCLFYRMLIKNSAKAYLLTDRTKIVKRVETSVCDFSALSGVISDFEFSDETKANYPDVVFCCVQGEN